MRTAKVLDRLKAEQSKNPDVPHYDSMGTPWPKPPSDVKTAGYWKLEGRRPARGEQPCAFVVSGHGSRYNPTGWVAAYHLSQTVEIRRRQAAPQPERLTTAARPIAPEPLPLIEDDRDETRQRLDSLARLLERAPLGGQVLYLDTETTGLAPTTNDLLEVAVVDESGAVLLDPLVRPRRRQAWPEAQAVHGIRPEDVATAPELATVAAQLAEVIEAADALVIYNAQFDLGFLPARVRKLAAQKAVCAMEAYSLWVGDWNDYHGNYRWFRLTAAAMAAGHTWSGQAHRALADTLAARSVWQWLHAQALPNPRDV